MIVDRERPVIARRSYDLDVEMRGVAHTDAQGIPLAGRRAELSALRRVGSSDLSLGRIFEGHLNGAQLVARYGTPDQRALLSRAIDAGKLFAVWNTQDASPVRIEPQGDGFILRGAKTWASGAGSIDIALITAALPDGATQMCLVPFAEAAASIDASRWRPLGMEGSDSFTVDFDGVRLSLAHCVGQPDDYEKQPWFLGGALRFAAVQTGAIDRLVSETITYLRLRGRDGDPFQRARVAEMCIARETASHWLDAGCRAWQQFDAEPAERHRAAVLDTVDKARTVVERAALDTIERAVRSVGARGLVEPEPFGALIRDLHMYLRQPAPDAALQRIGCAAFVSEPG